MNYLRYAKHVDAVSSDCALQCHRMLCQRICAVRTASVNRQLDTFIEQRKMNRTESFSSALGDCLFCAT